jgi:peptidoglycan/xylan/chitin deacetylase (PgdA/CDA1 family)
MNNTQSLISFAFDDVPKSSCVIGGEILKKYGLSATYYLSMRLMDGVYSIGTAFSRNDLDNIIAAGHEIGCHTYGHLDAWNTNPDVFEASIQENQSKLNEIYPGKAFMTFSYPINTPHPKIKQKAGESFICCRGGGQTYNSNIIDLNLLRGYFIDKRNRDNRDSIIKIIDENCDKKGWLIVCTHDVDEKPSPYGCTPQLYEDLVGYSYRSGARILPVYNVSVLLGIVKQHGEALDCR